MTTLYDIDIALDLETPYLVHGNDPGRFGLDATLFFDHLGRHVLPGTLIAGRIAEVWAAHGTDLDAADRSRWFGRPGFDAGWRARLRTNDLAMTSPLPEGPAGSFDAARIRQDDGTGAVAQGQLLLIEQLGRPGALVSFAGTWQVWGDESDDVKRLCHQLRAALLVQTQVGAYRGVGFGRLRGASVTARPAASAATGSVSPEARRSRFELTTADALCVSARRRRGNVFESADVLTGGALKGALATTLCQREGVEHVADLADRSLLAKHFDAIRFSHALPAPVGGARPMPLPQSLVWYCGGLRDAWRCASPPASLDEAPAFQTDWKGSIFAKAAATQGWGRTNRHLRVRTAIDGGKAKDESLFAMECVASPRESGRFSTCWLFDVCLDRPIPDGDLARLWAELLEHFGWGLAPLGKTDARATVRAVTEGEPQAGQAWPATSPSGLRQGALVPLVLVTDALLFPTDRIAGLDHLDLTAVYREAFADLLEVQHKGDAMGLSHHFATQRLAAGDRWQERLSKRQKPYQPVVLTEAGSVFVFEVLDPEGAYEVLSGWADGGLPLPNKVRGALGDDWRFNPYLPSNGYGEVVVQPQHGVAPLTGEAHA